MTPTEVRSQRMTKTQAMEERSLKILVMVARSPKPVERNLRRAVRIPTQVVLAVHRVEASRQVVAPAAHPAEVQVDHQAAAETVMPDAVDPKSPRMTERSLRMVKNQRTAKNQREAMMTVVMIVTALAAAVDLRRSQRVRSQESASTARNLSDLAMIHSAPAPMVLEVVLTVPVHMDQEVLVVQAGQEVPAVPVA